MTAQLDSTSYLGNRKLKAAGVVFEWTDEQRAEYMRCAMDPIYFIKKYVMIISIDKGVIPFAMYPFQEEMIRTAVDNRFTIAKMPRQVGKTTTIAAMMLWYILFHENFQAAILAHKQKGAQSIVGKIAMAYEYIPKWMQAGVVEWNKASIKLDNGSFVEAFSTSADSVRGGAYSFVYLDEFAFVPPNMQEEFWTSTYPVISSSKTAKVFITSTPNGYNLFWKIWKDSEEGRNSYQRCSVNWWDVPGRDDAWREETIKNTSEKQFSQEFECEFLGSSLTLISAKKLGMLTFSTPIQETTDFCIYEEPVKGHTYVLVSDVARGTGNDYSAFIVFDITESPYRIVAKYRNNEISHMVYPQYVYQFATSYNQAFVLVETNDIGQVVSDILYYEYEYENLFLTQSKGRSGQQIGSGFGGALPTFGLRTTVPVKRIGCMNLKSLVEGDKLILNDNDLIYELARFISTKSSFAAEEGCHDDLVMCCVLFAWLVHQEYFKELSDTDMRKALYEDQQAIIEDSLTPFGFITDGTHPDEIMEENAPIRNVADVDAWFKL